MGVAASQAAAPQTKRTLWQRRQKRPERRSKLSGSGGDSARAAPSKSFRKESPMAKLMSKSELIQIVADQHSLSRKDVKSVIESLASVGYKELKKNGAFLLPGFAKFVVIKKPA